MYEVTPEVRALILYGSVPSVRGAVKTSPASVANLTGLRLTVWNSVHSFDLFPIFKPIIGKLVQSTMSALDVTQF